MSPSTARRLLDLDLILDLDPAEARPGVSPRARLRLNRTSTRQSRSRPPRPRSGFMAVATGIPYCPWWHRETQPRTGARTFPRALGGQGGNCAKRYAFAKRSITSKSGSSGGGGRRKHFSSSICVPSGPVASHTRSASSIISV